MGKDFQFPISNLCDGFIKIIKFNRRCLLNCRGLIIANFLQSLMQISVVFTKESINSGWSIRELKRQISTSLYERLLLSEGKTNKETVLALAEKGIEMATPLDIIKDPYVYLMRADRIWRVKHNGKNDQSNRQGKTVCKIGYDTTQNQYRGDI